MSPPRRFTVNGWLAQPDLNTLTGHGRTVRVEPKVMALCVRLAEARGAVVTKAELLDSVWTGTFVEDDALTRSVSELRRAFGDDARQPRFVETIPKRGYRLLGEIVFADDLPTRATATPAGSVQRRRPGRVVAAIGALAAMGVLGGLAWRSTRPDIPDTATPPMRVIVSQADVDGSRPELGRAVETAIRAAFERDLRIAVVPIDRVDEVARLMRLEDTSRLEAHVAAELGRREGQTDAVITTRLETVGGLHTLTISLATPDGAVPRQFVLREPDEARLVSGARREILRLQGRLPAGPRAPPLPPVTTRSMRALVLFDRAVAQALSDDPTLRLMLSTFAEEDARPRPLPAIPLLEEALQIDEGFTTARAWLALMLREARVPPATYRAHATRVLREAPTVSSEERLFVAGVGHLLVDQPADAALAFEAVLQAPSSFVEFPARMLLAFVHGTQGHAADENVQIVRMADLRPRGFNLNARAAEILFAADGDARRAAPYITRARAAMSPSVIQRDGSCFLAAWLQYLPVFERWRTGDIDGALTLQRTSNAAIDAQVSHVRDAMATMSGYIWLALGRIRESEEAFNKVGHTGQRHMNLASIAELVDDRAALASHLSSIEWSYTPSIFAKAGLFARADEMLRRPLLHQLRHEALWARGERALAERAPGRAVRLMQQAVELQRPRRDLGFYSASESLAAAWHAAGEPLQARRVLEESVAEHPAYVTPGPAIAWWIKAHLLLADEYRRTGDTAMAEAAESAIGPVLARADPSFAALVRRGLRRQ